MSKKSKIITGLGAASTLAAATDFFLCRTLFDQTLNRKKLKKGKQLSLADADLNDDKKHGATRSCCSVRNGYRMLRLTRYL